MSIFIYTHPFILDLKKYKSAVYKQGTTVYSIVSNS